MTETLVAPAPPAPATPVVRDHRLVLRCTLGLVAVAVLGQRFVLPAGGFPVALPLVALLVAVAVLLANGALRQDRLRTELYLLAAGGLVVAAWAGTWFGHTLSVTSLALLLVLYLPWTFTVRAEHRHLVDRVSLGYLRIVLVAAAAGTAQMGLQLAGLWRYEDLLLAWVPKQFLAEGFNTSIPIEYGSPIHKANAFVFLEPSFLSQFCALALVIAVVHRVRAWQLLLLALGMASTLSGTGILLLAVGMAVVLLRAPRLVRPAYLVAAATGVAVLFATPAAGMLLDRSDETTQQGSSGYLRFVQPYTEVADGLAEEPVRYALGAGPGASDRLLESAAGGGQAGEAVVYTIAPKLAFEYGLPVAVLFTAFLAVSVLQGRPRPAVGLAVVVMLFFLSGSLLQPHTVALAWVLTSLWSRPAGTQPAAARS